MYENELRDVIERVTKWCADNYGGEWDNGLTPPSGWMWALAKDEGLILMYHDPNCPLITEVDVAHSELYGTSLHVHATMRWCFDTYGGEWRPDLTPPKGWVWAWLRNGDLVLIYPYTRHPTIGFKAVNQTK